MWKDIKGYEGLYRVSDDGMVQRIFKHGVRNVKGRDGTYLTVSLCKNSVNKTFSIHRLVAETFLPEHGERMEVNHKDGNKHNNHLDNLEWVEQKQNLYHAIEKLNASPYGKPARKVRATDTETGETREFVSISDAARSVGKMSARTPITYCCQGLQQTAYGCTWEYAD